MLYSRANRSALITIMTNQVHENNAVNPSRSRKEDEQSDNKARATILWREKKGKERKKRMTSKSGTVGFVYLNARIHRKCILIPSAFAINTRRDMPGRMQMRLYFFRRVCCRAIKFIHYFFFYIDLSVSARPSGDSSYRDALCIRIARKSLRALYFTRLETWNRRLTMMTWGRSPIDTTEFICILIQRRVLVALALPRRA